MDENESQADSAPRRPPSGRGTAHLRSRAQQLLSAQRARLEQIDVDLTSQCEDLLHSATETLAADAQSIQREFDRRNQTLVEEARQHQSSLDELRRQQDALARKQAELESARSELADGQQSLKRAQAEMSHDAEHLARSRGRAQQLEERLARESEQLEVRREQTKNQRRRIAQELKAERASQGNEIDDLRRTIDNMRITQQRGVEEATAELRRKREELEQRRQQHQQEITHQQDTLEKRTAALNLEAAGLKTKTADLETARDELETARSELERRERQLSNQQSTESAQRADQVRQLSDALAEARETAAASTATTSELLQSVEELRQSHERLRESAEFSEQRHGELQRKHELLQQQHKEQRVSLADPQLLEDAQRRFEMAISDVRDLKRRNAELEEQLISLRADGIGSSRQRPDENGSSDWEATKRRMLESLEADPVGNGDPDQIEQRLTVESTIQITDEIVARKDREIVELQLLMSQQSRNIGAVAVGAAAIGENFDRDELIQQEREKLRKLQEEWRDKLRQAEIDISIERARIARQRVEIDDKVSAYDSARAQHTADDSASNPGNQPKQPSRGRWLARLGLKDDPG